MAELDIIERVFILAVSKREDGESMQDTLESLVNTGMFEGGMREAKEVLESLKASNYIAGENLTMLGVMVANETEKEFKQ